VQNAKEQHDRAGAGHWDIRLRFDVTAPLP
jgi:hypothetical protein